MCIGVSWSIFSRGESLHLTILQLKTIYLHLTGQVQFEQYSASNKSKLKERVNIKILD